MSRDWIAQPAGPARGSIRVPGDKSISHRALMIATIAEGSSRVSGFLEGEDTRATERILLQLGARIEAPAASERIVHGLGLHGLSGSDRDLDCGNSGTGMRLLTGLLAGQRFSSRLVGDRSLSERPMARVITPLSKMGARIEARDGNLPPIIININNGMKAIDYNTLIPSAQVKSAILLAGLYARGETTVRESQPTRDYTERMLGAFGWPVRFAPGSATVPGGHRLVATDVEVPADFSSAAFLMVAACLLPGSDLRLLQVGMNPRRTGLLSALRLMGADIGEENHGRKGGEDVADLRVRSSRLRGIRLPTELVPDMIDEFPILFVAAALADGRTVIDGIGELRVKESDRLSAMARALAALGAQVAESSDGIVIEGGELQGGEVASLGDHRVAMAMMVAAQRAAGPVLISDCANVDTSFPGFVRLATDCGLGLRVAEPGLAPMPSG